MGSWYFDIKNISGDLLSASESDQEEKALRLMLHASVGFSTGIMLVCEAGHRGETALLKTSVSLAHIF